MLARESEHGSVVAGIAGLIQEVDTGDGGDRPDQPLDDIETPTLGDVGDGFDQHAMMLAGREPRRRAPAAST